MRVRVCQRKIHFPPEECVCDAFDCDGQSTGPRDRMQCLVCVGAFVYVTNPTLLAAVNFTKHLFRYLL